MRKAIRVKYLAVTAVTAVCAVALGISGTVIAPTPVAVAADRDKLAKDRDQKQREMNELKADLEGVSADLREAAIVLQDTRAKIPLAEQELAVAEAELSAAQREAEAKAALLEAAQNQLEDIKGTVTSVDAKAKDAGQSLAEIARSTYRGETTPSTVDLLMNSASPEEFMDAYRVNEALTRTQTTALAQFEQQAGKARNRQARQSAVEERVNQLKKEADELVQVTEEKRNAAESKRNELKALEQTIAEKSALLESRKGEVQASLDAETKEYQEISAQIAKIDAENRKNAAASGGGASSAGDILRWPADGYWNVTSSYGVRIHPITGGRKMHYGVDIGVPCGVPQRAAAAGTVSYAGWYGSGGNTVAINHGWIGGASWLTRYMHYSSIAVSYGQYVQKGQIIGYTGTTGGSTGCHMHFEVWRNGSTINPMSMF